MGADESGQCKTESEVCKWPQRSVAEHQRGAVRADLLQYAAEKVCTQQQVAVGAVESGQNRSKDKNDGAIMAASGDYLQPAAVCSIKYVHIAAGSVVAVQSGQRRNGDRGAKGTALGDSTTAVRRLCRPRAVCSMIACT